MKADLKLAKAGRITYAAYCGGCHGRQVMSSGTAPDLRASSIPLDANAFRTVLRGAFVENGMPAYPELTEQQIEELRHFVRSQAEGTLDLNTPIEGF